MRLVLDTNVLARVVMSPHGPAAELFDRVRAGHLLVSSPEMLSELSRVLGYERVRSIHQLDDVGVERFVREVEAGSQLVRLPQDIPAVVNADPDDDSVIATAILGQAEAICTRNRHFYAADVIAYLRRWSIEVIDDVQLLVLLRNQDDRTDTP
jgi:putative PIN family toxin of toxin-antitoxin system